jgi:hypothetical protein
MVQLNDNTPSILDTAANYYIHLASNQFKSMERLYALDEKLLLKSYMSHCRSRQTPPKIDYDYRTNFSDGVISTPLPDFHIKSTSKHKGSHHFLDLNTNAIYSRLSETHAVVKKYSPNYQLLLHEDKPS